MKNLKPIFLFVLAFTSCKKDDTSAAVNNIETAEKVSIDRFSSTAGNLMVRTPSNGLPSANSPVNFDQPPSITQVLGPAGQKVAYYNFDVRSTIPAPIYVLFREGEANPVAGHFNIADVLPGEAGDNDFW